MGITPYPQSAYCLATHPSATIMPNNTLPADGTFTASPTLSTLQSNGEITVSNTQPDQYTITYEPPSSVCKLPVTQTIQLENDLLTAVCPVGVFCEGSGTTPAIPIVPTYSMALNGTFSYSPSPLNGQWSSSQGWINTYSGSANQYQLSYTTFGNACNRTFSNLCTVLIDSELDASFSYNSHTHCSDDPNSTPTPQNPNGLYSAAGISINSQSGTIDWAASTAIGGPIPVKYAFPGVACPSEDTFHVYRYLRDIVRFQYGSITNATSASFCEGTTHIAAVPDSGFAFGGVFSQLTSTGTMQLNPSNGEIVSATPGQYTIRYTSSGICPATYDFPVTIQQDPPLALNYLSTACRNPGTTLQQTLPIALPGHYFSSDVVIDSQTGEINVMANNALGLVTVYFSTDAPACPDTASAVVELFEPDNAIFHYGIDPNATYADFCSNELDCNPVYGSNFDLGGTYTIITPNVPGNPVLNDSTGRLIFNNFRGQLMVQYATTPDPPCGSAIHTFTVNVLAAPQANFNYTEAYYCQTGDTIYPAPNYVDSLGKFVCLNSSNFVFVNAQQGSFVPNTIPPGNYTIEHQVWVGQDTNQCRSTVTDQVEIKAIDMSTHLESDTLVYCAEDTFTVNVSGSPQLPGGWLIKPNLLTTVVEDPSQYMGYYFGNLDTAFTLLYTGYGYCNEEDSIILTIDQPTFTPLTYLPGELGGDAYCTNDTTGPLVPSFPGMGTFFYANVGNGQLALDTLTGVIDLSASDQGVYNVHYRINDFCRQDGLDTVTVFQGLDPNSLVLSYSASPDSLCEGDLLMLSAYNAQHRTLYIMGDSLGVVEPDFLLDSVWDQESIMVRYRDNNGCYEDVHDTLHVHAYPTPIITPQDTLAYVKPENILVNLESNNPQTIFQWWLQLSDRNVTLKSDSSGFTAALDSGATDALRPELELQLESTVTQVEYLIQPSSYGCVGEMDSVTFLLIPADNPAIFIPGAISPNGDGKNDEWRITWDESAVDENDYEILLFNRSGGRVLSMSPLVRTWDGENLPDGVYQYILRDKQGKYLKKGGLTIRRQVYLDKN